MLPLTFVLMLPLVRGVIVSGVHWWHSESYRQATFVMDEFGVSDGVPYIAGHLDGESEPRRLVAIEEDGERRVKAAPSVAFAAGAAVDVWHSDRAPRVMLFGDEINDVPIVAMPERPGLLSLVIYSLGVVGAIVLGFWMTMWVAARFSPDFGDGTIWPADRRQT